MGEQGEAGRVLDPGARRRVTVVIDVGPDELDGCSDSRLAMLWHVGQGDPVEFGDCAAGELVEKLGREIIRRWLRAVEPQLWRHQGRDHYWDHLRQLGKWDSTGRFVPDQPAREPGTEPV